MFYHVSVICDSNKPSVGPCVGPIYDLSWCIKMACERVIEQYPEYAGDEAAICKDLRETSTFYPNDDSGWSLHIIAPIKDKPKPIDSP